MRALLSFILCTAAAGQTTRHMRGSVQDVDKAAFAGELDPVHDSINLYRSKLGLANLTKSDGLVQSAKHTALKINAHRTLNHTLGNTTTASRITEAGVAAGGKVGEVYGVSFCRAPVKTCAKLLVMTWASDPEFNKTLTSKGYMKVGAAWQPAYAKDSGHNKTTTMMMMGTDVEMYAAAGEEYGPRGSTSLSMYNWDIYVAHFA